MMWNTALKLPGRVLVTVALAAALAASQTACVLAPRRSRSLAAKAPADAAVIRAHAEAKPAAAPPPAPVTPRRRRLVARVLRRRAATPAAAEGPAAPPPGRKVEVHLDLARALEQQGQPDEALEQYQAALLAADARRGRDADARRALAHRKLAAALDRRGRFSQAEPHYKSALELAPRDPYVWNDAGYSAYVQGRFDEAETRLRRARELAPTDPLILTNLGLALAASGQVDAALEPLRRASGDAAAHANLAYVLAATGQNAAAVRRYREALALQPDLQPAREALNVLQASTRTASATLPPLPPEAEDETEDP